MNMTPGANGNTRLSHQFVDAITNHSREKWTLKMKNKKPIDIKPNISPSNCMMDCMIDAISKT